MEYLTKKKFSFVCGSLVDETFGVVMFKGFEAVSKPYEFDIMLVTSEADIDMDTIMNDTAHLIIHGQEDDAAFNGVLSQFEQLHQVGEFFFYRAILVPRLWWLSLNRNNQVFIDTPITDTISAVIQEGRLAPGIDFEFHLLGNYSEKDYVCQYGESHLNFISRWLEYEGIYYFFQQTFDGETKTPDREKLILTDSNIIHTDIELHPNLSYLPSSALENLELERNINVLTCRQRQVPHDILLKDHNYEKPSLAIEGRAIVDENGRGSVYSYGEHFQTVEEGNILAIIRAQELLCRKKEFFGESSVPDLKTGYTFNLTNHFIKSFNQKYLVTEIVHEGSQTGYLISGIQEALANLEKQVSYKNAFTAIPTQTTIRPQAETTIQAQTQVRPNQFRPERKAPKPNISGTLHATIDAAGSGDHAELDAQGRYKVRLPFDIHSSHMGGKASCYLRMLQPHAGPNASAGIQAPSGFHFPLRKGTEVLLSFINGDPDRPVIAGSVPNPHTTSPVTETNQTKSVMRDHYGNELVFDSTPGDEHIGLYSPHHNSGLVLGRSRWEKTDSDMLTYKFGSSFDCGAGSKASCYGGYSTDLLAGYRLGATIGFEHSVFAGASHSWTMGYRWEYSRGPFVQKTKKDAMITANEDIILGAGDEFCLAAGTQKEKESSEDPTNKSIIRATRKGITLSLGDKLTETMEGEGVAGWFEPDKDAFYQENKYAILNLFATVAGALVTAGIAISDDDYSGSDVVKGLFEATNLGWLLWAVWSAHKLYKKELSDPQIEPATHEAPPQKIWMYKDGTIGIVSTTGIDGQEENQQREENAKIILGTNTIEEVISSSINKEKPFYNSHMEKSNIKKYTEIKNTQPGQGQGYLEKNRKNYYLKNGSNIIIKKDEIDIRSGKADKEPNVRIQIVSKSDKSREGIYLKTFPDEKSEKMAFISIHRESGQISLNNEKTDSGNIFIKSKEQTVIHGKHVILNATDQIQFKGKSIFSNEIDHKNFKVKE